MNLVGQPRAVIRAAQRVLRETSRQYTGRMTAVPPSAWPVEMNQSLKPVIGVWRSSRFMATAYQERGAVRLSVIRTLLSDDGHWIDGIEWDELQAIKSQCGFADRDAIEVYPRDVDIVNVANMRHLWVLDEPLPLAWRQGVAT